MSSMLATVPPQPVPVLSKERFAELVGVSVDTVRGWISRGHVPVVHIGRRALVNVAAMTEEARRG
jgi:excisionase family DNA binding protein